MILEIKTILAAAGTKIVPNCLTHMLNRENKFSEIMKKYLCLPCGYIYDPAEGDPENGIFPGTPFEDLPEDWTCPACGVGKEHFEEI